MRGEAKNTRNEIISQSHYIKLSLEKLWLSSFLVSRHVPAGKLPPDNCPYEIPRRKLPSGHFSPGQLSLINPSLDNCPPDNWPP